MEPSKPYQLDGLAVFEKMIGMIESNVQKLLEEHNYNTLGNFLAMYMDFKRKKCSNFAQFFQRYSPPITRDHHTCVGLALELCNRLQYLDQHFPNLSQHFYIVSCEEKIESLSEYIALSERLDDASYALEKEHVLLCLKFQFNGRNGLLLCDPGYHVSRVIIIMNDGMYPNTGWFIQSEENNVKKEYNYRFSPLNDNFVEWMEKTTKNGHQDISISLIYTAKPYLTAVDVTERRNLVYNFRSLLARDQKGHLIAGIYFKVKENCDEFTIFYQDMGKQRLKIRFSSLVPPYQNKEKIFNIITICNEQLNLPEGALLAMLRKTGQLLNDRDYLRQLLEVNQCINIMSANN